MKFKNSYSTEIGIKNSFGLVLPHCNIDIPHIQVDFVAVSRVNSTLIDAYR